MCIIRSHYFLLYICYAYVILMANKLKNTSGQFGTLPVFAASISTILGAILFLRFGYAVGNVGFIGAIGIIVLGHLVTIPTALAVAEIATNRKVEGGGDYYVISRSFGLNIGAAIGIALYLSQAISIAFYIIAFQEAFLPFGQFLNINYDIPFGHFLENKKIIGLFSMFILSALMLTKGANIGVKALYVVASVIFISLIMFFLGSPTIELNEVNFFAKIENSDSFFYVFTIIFPAFTGISAGLGLSGDLKEPKKSIPRGTLIATILGAVIYVLIALKLSLSVSLEDLANTDSLVMSRIAIWGPIIPIGLACAAISSALGSIMIAPRTLQALGKDRIFPSKKFDFWIAKGSTKNNEPTNSTIITCIIAFIFIYIGDINFVAQIISMFFMVTYGAICLISFLEHFSGDPSYRPTFKSRWYISLIGALLSVWLMFKMNTFYAFTSIFLMVGFYYYISKRSDDNREFVNLFRNVLVQFARQLQIFLQRREDNNEKETHWRPFVVSFSNKSLERKGAFDLTRWISYKYGFGTYIHYIQGYLSKSSFQESKKIQNILLNRNKSNVYVDTLISPSFTSALAQVVQLSSISGKENNLILLEYCAEETESLDDIINNINLLHTTGYDLAILRSKESKIDKKEEIHIWISSTDYENSNMMILLGYIILGHPEWKNAKIKVFSIYPKDEFEEYKRRMFDFIESGRLPIAPQNMKMVPQSNDLSSKSIIDERSKNSDLTIIGFRGELAKKKKADTFEGYNNLGNILFVNSINKKEIE